MINCVIVDDEQHAIDILKHHIAKTDFLNLVFATTNATEALKVINSQPVDLLFQDIHMPDISGVDVVKAINGKCSIILATAYPDYALEGYELGVVDYLLKPVSFPRFIKAVQKVSDYLAKPFPIVTKDIDDDFIYVKTGIKSKVVKINLDEIDYIESSKNYVTIHHERKRTLAYISLKELEDRLPPNRFGRVHRSYIIAYNKIVRIDNNQVVLKDIKDPILLGEAYKGNFWEKIKDRMVG